MKTKITSIMIGIAVIFAAGIMGCSSNSSDSSGSTTPRVAVGTMTKGSVIVNGVEFADTGAAIIGDDAPKASADLDDGMMVKVKGTVNADGLTGVAEKVEVVNEVRGVIDSPKGVDTLTVNGQTVLVDGGTVLANVADFASLAVNDAIEVHGGRDAAGIIHATRVEKLTGTFENEVRGAVSGKTASTFVLGGVTFTFNGSTVMVPSGATFENGDIVEVHLDGTTATRISVEHLDHPEFEAAEGQEFSVEGMLSGYTSSGVFSVGAQQVQLGASVMIVGGVEKDLVDGMKVEAEGHIVAGGILTADKIKIKESIRIEANADAAGSVDVLGKTVKTTSLTKLGGNLVSIATLTVGDGLRIRGFVNVDGATITATRVDALSNPVGSDEVVIQGPVTAVDASAKTFVILGITVDCTVSIARPDDDSDSSSQSMTTEAFFSALAAGKTVVKAKGTFSGGTLAATEIEIQ